MKSYREEILLEIQARRGFVNITREVERALAKSGIREGMCLVNSMHITSSVFINDDESGLHADIEEWVQRLAPGPAADDRSPGPDYRHHHSGEDNGDAHLKRTLMHHQAMLPVTKGGLDLGPWEQVFYAEFDGKRKKRVVVKIIGE